MKVAIRLFLVLLFIGSAGWHNQALAHGEGPHGGALVDIPPYHLEFQVMTGMLHIYVIDTQKKTVPPKDITGKLLIQFPDGNKKEAPLSAMGDALMANADIKEGSPFIAIATVQIQGKTYTGRFSYKGSKATEEKKSSAAPKTSYQVITVPNGGTVRGQVLFSGTLPHLDPLPVNKDQQVCGKDGKVPNEALKVGPNKGVEGTIVYLEGITKGKAPALQQMNLVLDQKNCLYVPRIQAGVLGGTIALKNSDPILHTIHATKGGLHVGKDVMSVATPAGLKEGLKQPLNETGLIGAMCHAGHDWMAAFVYVFNHPYFAVTDVNGSFEITGVPPGIYQLKAWHEGWKFPAREAGLPPRSKPVVLEQKVSVTKSGISNVKFELKS